MFVGNEQRVVRFCGDELPVLHSLLYFLHPTHHLNILHVSFRFSPVELPFSPSREIQLPELTSLACGWRETKRLPRVASGHVKVESFVIRTGGK